MKTDRNLIQKRNLLLLADLASNSQLWLLGCQIRRHS